MIERAAKQGMSIAAIRPATVIFQPCGVIGVLVEVAVRNVVVLAADHATKAAEIALHHVGMLAVAVAVGFAVVDATGLELHFQRVPMGGLVSEQLVVDLLQLF